MCAYGMMKQSKQLRQADTCNDGSEESERLKIESASFFLCVDATITVNPELNRNFFSSIPEIRRIILLLQTQLGYVTSALAEKIDVPNKNSWKQTFVMQQSSPIRKKTMESANQHRMFFNKTMVVSSWFCWKHESDWLIAWFYRNCMVLWVHVIWLVTRSTTANLETNPMALSLLSPPRVNPM